ncbi:outer membrane lipoprotein LolB [Ramlibacter sp.]|uniref:outer membrane lipoprotein LolB n=1 Tax=Ramlibacter sp. TaxID=1917967 RepID=UPI002CE44420|nr:outer membrane lipoprotein LolB [Ramlibacter sp.]HWI83859.1 outer membrane lipoprotein LolB [Ramlibacter sp.]
MRIRWTPAALLLALLAGCASAPPALAPAAGGTGPWSGRLALQVKDNASQSFAAMFELKGSAHAGELTLSSPIGGTLAVLTWSPGSATLRSDGKTREFESVDALVGHATGAAIPVAALFDWLRGIATPVAGWRPDLSQLPAGRIAATRLEPPPEADLRVALDR